MFCEKSFRELSEIKNHYDADLICNVLRYVGFTCLKCNKFNSKDFKKIKDHLKSCYSDLTDGLKNCEVSETDDEEKNSTTIKTDKSTESLDDEEEKVILEQIFGKTEILNFQNHMENKYEEIKTKRSYTKELRELKSLRRCIIKNGDLDFYKEILTFNLKSLKQLLNFKKFKIEKINKIILQHFTVLDLRLLLHEDSDGLIPDGSLLNEINQVLMYRDKLELFSFEKFINYILNYSLVLFDLESNFERDFKLLNNTYCYFGNKYKFYKLKRNNNIKYWEMDSNTEQLTVEIITNMITYLVQLFKSHYMFIFKDNIFRKNFIEKCGGYKKEIQNILKSFIFVSNEPIFHKYIRSLIVKNFSKERSEQDNFNLSIEDPLEHEFKNNIKENILLLFDPLDFKLHESDILI